MRWMESIGFMSSRSYLHSPIALIDELHRRSNLGDVHIERPKKFDHLVLGPAAGEGLPDRFLLEQRLLARCILDQSLTIESRPVESRPVDLFTIGNTSYSKLERSVAILSVFINFIQFGNNKQQPLNSGFIALRGTAEGIKRGKAFLQQVLEVYSSKFMRASRILGDQLALAWVIRSSPNFDIRRFSGREAFLDNIGGASCFFFNGTEGLTCLENTNLKWVF
ncbi:hypothetical protein OROHE_026039 [Orobanche hederae]